MLFLPPRKAFPSFSPAFNRKRTVILRKRNFVSNGRRRLTMLYSFIHWTPGSDIITVCVMKEKWRMRMNGKSAKRRKNSIQKSKLMIASVRTVLTFSLSLSVFSLVFVVWNVNEWANEWTYNDVPFTLGIRLVLINRFINEGDAGMSIFCAFPSLRCCCCCHSYRIDLYSYRRNMAWLLLFFSFSD